MEPPPSFADVLAAAQSGDGTAYRHIWERYAPAVARFAKARGSYHCDDLTSEVFLAVFRALPGFRGGEAAFKGFVFTVAHRRLVDELRARARRVEEAGWTAETDSRRSPSAEDDALDSLSSARARTMLDALSPDQRDVLVLRIFADLTIEEIATVLGKQPGAVKALQRRGMNTLRRRFADSHTPTPASGDWNQ